MVYRIKLALTALAGVCLTIAIAMLAIIVTSPDLRIRTLLADARNASNERGVLVREAPPADDCKGPVPLHINDRVFEIAGRSVTNIVGFSRSLLALRNARLEPGARLYPGADPTELSSNSSLALVEIDAGERFAKVRFWREGESFPLTTWVRLNSMPIGGLSLSLLWFGLQLLVFSVSAVAYWNSPEDRAARAFFVLCSFTLVALLGGSHWWVIAGIPWLSAPFAVAAIMLPAVLLHFSLLYPRPRKELERHPVLFLWTIYGIPTLAASVMLLLIALAWGLSHDVEAHGPFAQTFHAWEGRIADDVLLAIRALTYLYLAIAAGYFAATVAAIVHSARRTEDAIERRQVRWLLAASLAAAVPLSYATYLAFFRRLDFALGAAQLPMFLASLSFMLAYAMGVVRYQLMLVDRVVSQGLVYHVFSAGVTLLYSLLVAIGCVMALRQEISFFGQIVSVVVVLMLAIMVLEWVRRSVPTTHRAQLLS